MPESGNSDYSIDTNIIKRLLSNKKKGGNSRGIGDKNSIERTQILSQNRSFIRKFRENESRDKKLEVFVVAWLEQRWTSCSQFLASVERIFTGDIWQKDSISSSSIEDLLKSNDTNLDDSILKYLVIEFNAWNREIKSWNVDSKLPV